MAKQSGLGDLVLVSGVDVSGDVGSIGPLGGGPAAIEMPGVDVSAQERYGGMRDGRMSWSSWFNDARAHPLLAALPTTDVGITYSRGRSIGSPSAFLVAKQVGYNPQRSADGGLSFSLEAQANSYGLDWGVALTAGLRTDTGATNGAGFDQTTASTAHGWQAMLHVTAITGTSVTVTLQDSADNSSFSAITGGAFTAATGAGWQRLEGGRTATVRRYVRAVTTGTFTSATFHVVFVRNETAVTF